MSPPVLVACLRSFPTRQADRPLHLKDFCQHIGTKDLSRAAHHVRRAEESGLMQKIGWVGEWVAMTGATWLDGDFNGDGNVNDADAAILAAHWGEGVSEESVPEPGSLALLAGMAVMGVVYLRRRKA
jgi:hypothetical protein